MDELEKLKKEYIKTAAPANIENNWEQIASKLGHQSHFDTKMALAKASILFALVILVSGILIGNFKGKVSNNHDLAVKNGDQEVKNPQEATESVSPSSPNIDNIQQLQQEETDETESEREFGDPQKFEDRPDERPKRKNRFWEFVNNFYKRGTAEVQSLEDQTDDNHNRRERQEDN